MASPRPNRNHPTRGADRLARRRRRLLGGTALALGSWVALAGLPLGATTGQPGTMHTKTVTLSGPGADAAAVATRSATSAATPGWSTTVDVEDGTQAVAASWTGAPTGAVDVRGRAGDTWGDWVELEANPDERPDDATRDSGGMAWFGRDGVDEVELRVASGSLDDLQLQSMRYEEPSDGGATTAVAGADAAQPTILPRSSWTSKGWAYGNSGCASGPITASSGVKLAVVHHTVNSNTYAAEDVPAMLASIYAYHTGTNGWCDIAYNFVIDRFGRIWEGRSGGIDKAIVGGHAQGFNTGSMGVSFLGQFEPGASPAAAQPSAAAIDAAGRLIGWKLGLFGVDPTATVSVTSGGSNKWPSGTVLTLPTVIGHRDVGYTACPGQYLYDQLAAIRLKAKAAQGSSATTTTTAPTTTTTTTPPPPPVDYSPFASATGLVSQTYSDLLYRSPSSSDLDYWAPRINTSWPAGRFVAYLLNSAEADGRVHAVTRLYMAYFRRVPDHGGFRYWIDSRGDGRTLSSISSAFANSAEFEATYGSLTNAQFVDLVYRNVLGRDADASGAAYWTGRLDGGSTRGSVMAGFSQSGEHISRTNDGVDVVALYEGLLQRAVADNVYDLFTAGLGNGSTTLADLATYVWESGEYQGRFG